MPAMTFRRIGHRGAALIAPGNTPESFDAALAAGVDMIEFDVLPEDFLQPATSPLILAHDYEHDLRHAPTLQQGLNHLASQAFADIELDVDLKLPGYEDRVVTALQQRGLVERSLVSSMYRESLARVREIEPRLRLGWSVPKLRRDPTTSWVYKVPAYALLQYAQRVLPRRAAAAIYDGAVDALMAHHKLVTPALVRAVDEAGGELYVWTVDDAAHIRALEALGVSGVITNDPRLFAPGLSPSEARP